MTFRIETEYGNGGASFECEESFLSFDDVETLTNRLMAQCVYAQVTYERSSAVVDVEDSSDGE